ncbi:MAG: HAMP domain-containing histidine kinase [Brevefilum sp.]|nr:HAMP domain-containing histidine kinase [Brevefilum sp.]
MLEILVPLTSPYTIVIPDNRGALFGWVIGFVGIIIFAAFLQDRSFRITRATLLWSAALSLLVLALTPFIGILPRMSTALNPGDVPFLHLMFFTAVPWMVAGGVLGVMPSVLLAMISGLLLAYLDTNNIFTPLVLMGLAVVFSWCVRQRYRTSFYQWLRFPVIAGAISLAVISPLVFIVTAFSATGSAGERVGIAIDRFPMVMFALGGMVLIGGVVCVIVSAVAQQTWGSKSQLKPAPGEFNLNHRLFAFILPTFLVLLWVVFISTWMVAQNQARKMAIRQLISTSEMAAASLGDYFGMTGSTTMEDMLPSHTFIRAFQALEVVGGIGQIVNADGAILYQTQIQQVETPTEGTFFTTATFRQSQGADGQTWLHYFQPVNGTNLGVVAVLPGWAIDAVAWQSTFPVLLITSGGMVLVLLAVWIGVAPMATELEKITAAIDTVSIRPFESNQREKGAKSGKGPLSQAFQAVIDSQQSRLDHQAELLAVSSRIAGQLNLTDAMHIILTAALTHGASSARLILSDATGVDQSGLKHALGLGTQSKRLAVLDPSVVELSRREGALVLSVGEIGDKLPGAEEIEELACVTILPLKWKDLKLGVFWVAFPAGLTRCAEEEAYLQELSRMASLVIVNTKTYRDTQSSRILMESIFDLLPDAVLITDLQERVVYQNKTAQAVLGSETGPLEGKSLSSLLAPQDSLEQVWRTQPGPHAREVHINGKAYQLISSPIQIKPNQAGQMLILKDLTQQRNESSIKSEFVTTVSHELRSPLTLILGYAKILRLTGNMNEQQDTYISNIIDGVQEMQNLVQKLLDIGRLEGSDPLAIQPISVADITRQVVERVDAQAKQKNVQMVIKLPESPVVIEADPTFLALALKNLVENAIKFSKMEGEVIFSAWRDDDRVIFAVEDKGIGIAPLDQRRLFKNFSQASAQTGQEQAGSGLGLAIVKSIAERHGGQVRLESQLGKGSIFYFEIPRKQSC